MSLVACVFVCVCDCVVARSCVWLFVCVCVIACLLAWLCVCLRARLSVIV